MDSRQALDHFEYLLSRDSPEADFQGLFAECPEILSLTLPLKLAPSDIRPLARPGRSEPDFLAYPSAGMVGEYGVIELKRPSSRILVEPRKGQLELSRTALTAVGQGIRYRDGVRAHPTSVPALMLGNQAHIFVIMGLSDELATKLGADLYERQITGTLPSNCRLIPYDTLFQCFAESVPPRIMVLVPEKTDDLLRLLGRIERDLFDWSYFRLSETSMAYWIGVEDEANSVLGSSGTVLFDRYRFEIGNQKYVGEIATEGDNDKEFLGMIITLLRRLSNATMESGPFRIKEFLDGYQLIVGASDEEGVDVLSSQALSVLRKAALRCLQEDSSMVLLEDSSRALAELEHHGLIDWASMNSAGSKYLIHPAARLLL